MRFSLLHLSDLHRDVEDELDTKTLLDSLERDSARATGESPSVLRPSLCVVTGDMIYGASPSSKDPAAELSRQYSQTNEFLIGLADRLFGGDRAKIVVLPGNHDVSFSTFFESVELVPMPSDDKGKAELVHELFQTQSKLRWSWKSLQFFRIVKDDVYATRLEAFSAFYESFYQGKRKYSLDPASQYDVFDFPDYSFCVLALNSCFKNDPFRRAGAFHPEAITEVGRLAGEPTRTGWIVAAAWHHSISGGPLQDDYLDSSVLQHFIDSGISVALHGHQHFTDCVEERYRLGTKARKITVISAGTLCAGSHHLASGEPRSYNVVELDTSARVGRVHQRRMTNRDYSLPIWGPGHFPSSNSASVDIEISPPLKDRSSQLDLQLILERAESLVRTKEWDKVVALLRPHLAVPLARPLLLEALLELGKPQLTIELLSPPETNAEAVILGAAIYETGTPAEWATFLAYPLVAGSGDASVFEIAKRMRERITR